MAVFNDIFVMFLIVMTAFFVASEFAIVAIRRPTVLQLVESGHSRAKYVVQVTRNMNDYLAACQLGNTLAALAMGWVGEATMRSWLQPLFDMLPVPASIEGPIAIFVSFILITFLNVVLGELAPKTFTIHSTEKVALLIARPLIWWYYITFPLNWLLNHSANFITRLFGVKPDTDMDRMTPTELKVILEDSYRQGLLNPQEFRYMQNIFKLADVPAQEVMIPRMKMITISRTETVQDLLALTAKETYHIFPVTAERDKDHIVGMLQVSTVMAGLGRGLTILDHPIEKFMTPIMQVFEGMNLQELLFKMQQEGQTFVVLTDEYGGTSGLVTLEDVMEIIVGDMEEATTPRGIRKVAENHFVMEGNEPLVSVEEVLGVELSSPGVHTLSGWLLYQQFDIETGDCIEEAGWCFYIQNMNKNSIRLVEVIKKEASQL
ncbi:HlyC/CorC family transporter [Listeria grandensis]|uniref:HlyC/CorC family transporter n=1 Tax=Listeria grandensis TaxID=1494963 RepID=A0A7X0Y5I2_9LIST|nr:hemolysin family protein [Listeria grandensis]MBC1936934.1 HlyC/CorC family transporter [Listeria grandensis]